MCGHDGHMSMLLEAQSSCMTQRAPSRSVDARAWWQGTACSCTLTQLEALHSQGTVRLVFQPAEEGGAGGDIMIKEGALRACCSISGIKCHSRNPALTRCWFRFSFKI